MKTQILLLTLIVAALSSCSTAYKTGQTPDDVYFSPARPQDEYVNTEKQNDRQYRYDDEYYDDRYLRMKVRNRYQWTDLNDWYYYERAGFGYNYFYGDYYNPFNNWNYYYNPYCHSFGNNSYSGIKYSNIKPAVKPRSFNLSSYTNNTYNNINTNSKSPVKINSSKPVYNNSNTNNYGSKGLSNTIRTIFEGNNNSGSSGSSGRSYNPSSSGSSGNSSGGSSGSSGSSGGGGISRPVKN